MSAIGTLRGVPGLIDGSAIDGQPNEPAESGSQPPAARSAKSKGVAALRIGTRTRPSHHGAAAKQ